MAGAVEEFSRRPLPVKIAIFAAVGVVLGMLYWQFLYQPLKSALADAEAALASERSEARKLKEQKEEYDRKILRQDELKQQIEQNQKALPTESEMPAFFDMLARRTGEAGVEAVRRSVSAEVPIETFVKVPVDIEISGTFYQLKRFFTSLRPARAEANTAASSSDVEEKDRIVTIENLTISDPKVKSGEIMLTAKFTASTFRAADRAAEENQAGPPGAKGAPPSPPVPGTITSKPKEMKSQLEAAHATSDERTRNSVGSEEPAAPPGSADAGAGSGSAKGGR